MKNIFIIILTIFTTALNAQTLSLETMAQYDFGKFPHAEYVKDLNGLLNKYVGNWKGTFDGKTYEFNFTKKENLGENGDTKWDKLLGKLKITASNGVIEFNNFSKTDDLNYFRGINFQKDLKLYLMNFSGGKLSCIDYGIIYMNMKPETPNKMSISFYPDNDIVTEDCSNFKTTMPSNKIIYLTKQ